MPGAVWLRASCIDIVVVRESIVNSALELWGHTVVPGALHVVSTPIGNLGDITLRALATLAKVSAVCCEDTRNTRALLTHFGVSVPLIAVHEHNEAQSVSTVIERLALGESVALVSDAGTPLVSDPGARLVAAVAQANLRVVPVPGASSLLAALVASGLNAETFTMFGFLPRKGGERTRIIEQLSAFPHTAVLFESPHRLVDTLRDISLASGPGRVAAVGRELTKLYEEFRRGTLDELVAYYESTPPKGEIVIVLSAAEREELSESALSERAAELRAEGFRPREIVQRLVDEHGVPRNLAYRLAHDV